MNEQLCRTITLLTSYINNSPSPFCWSCSTEGSWDRALTALLACSRVHMVTWRDPNTHEQVPKSTDHNVRHQPLKSAKLIRMQKFLGITVIPVGDSPNAKHTLLIPFETWLLEYKVVKEIITAQSLFRIFHYSDKASPMPVLKQMLPILVYLKVPVWSHRPLLITSTVKRKVLALQFSCSWCTN